MLKKSLIIAAAIASIAVVASVPAKADPQISVGIGFGFGGYGGPGYGYYDGGYGYYDNELGGDYEPYRFHHRRNFMPIMHHTTVTCGQGASILRRSGFRGVSAYDCSQPTYAYHAWKHGDSFDIQVNSRGRIVSIDQAY